jgi:hypothetical protein
MKRPFKLSHDLARQRAIQAVKDAPEGWCVTVSEPTRSLDQNAAQWPLLQAFADQLEWPVNGAFCKLSAAEWKDLLSAAFRRESARLAMGLDGGVVMLGMKTREMSKREFGEWLEFLHSVAADRGVSVERIAA